MYEDYMKVLSSMPLFYDINKEELISLLNCIKPKIISCEKKSFIVSEGDRFTGIGVMLSGEVTNSYK